MIYFKDISQNDCIIASGTPDATTGYIRKSRHNHIYYAHRLAYSDTNGGIPEGYHVHHLCDNKLCVNSDHLVAITPSEHREIHTKLKSKEFYDNLTTCKLGHPLDGKNKVQRYCLSCHREVSKKWREKPENRKRMNKASLINYYKKKELQNV